MVTPQQGLQDAPAHSAALEPHSPLSEGFRSAVSAEIAGFLDRQRPVLAAMGPELDAVRLLAAELLQGGKRLRPAFVVWSYVAAAGVGATGVGAAGVGAAGVGAAGIAGDAAPLLAAAASLELLHVSALVHDDVMDSSDLRRGRPAAHRQFETLHRRSGWAGDAPAFGRAGAILLGDLLLMWSAEMLQRSGVPAADLERALPIVAAMRTEVTCGQYLDVTAQAQPLVRPAAAAGDAAGSGIERALDEASRVVEYKSARYTVQRPCQLGAALGGGSDALHRALAAYGSPLGRAFQFRDDLLGVFGDPAVTGKPSGDDLREGKRTVLVAHAYAHAGPAARRLLEERLGDPELDPAGVAALQQAIADSGAREAVEAMIGHGHDQALTALADAEMTDDGRTALTALADAAVRRVT